MEYRERESRRQASEAQRKGNKNTYDICSIV